MKSFIVTLCLVFIFMTPSKVSALVVTCVNCATFPTQGLQLVKEALTATYTYSTWLQDNVLDPIGNALVTLNQIQQQTNTINLVMGSLGGTSLLIQNPEQWIKNQGLNTVRISIADLNAGNGEYAQSALSTLVGAYRNSNDVKAKIDSLSRSSVPSLIQNNICKDEKLTATAKNDVLRADGTYDPTALQTRKRELYNSLCVGNPANDSVLAARLNRINVLRPDIGGWDTWLAITGGDNKFAASARIGDTVSETVASAMKNAENTLNQGGGIASATNCEERVSTGGIDDIANLPCRTQSVRVAASTLNSAFQEAVNAPLKKLESTFGQGIFRNISSVLQIIASARQLSNALNGTTVGGTGSVRVAINTSGSQTDLNDNPSLKNSLVNPIANQFEVYKESIDKLSETSKEILELVQKEESRLSGIKSCYQGLVDMYGFSEEDERFLAADSYVNETRGSYGKIIARANADAPRIAEARSYIPQIEAKIRNASSSITLTTAYEEFESRAKKGDIPKDSDASERESELAQVKSKIQEDTQEGGKGAAIANTCLQIAQSFYNSNQGGL